MGKITFAWIMLGLMGALTAWLAYRGYRRTRSMEGFVVGNRDMSPVFVGLSLAAQLTSVATFVVNPGLVYAYGLPALLGMGVAACLGITIGITVLSKGFRAVGEQLSAITVPGWLGSRYKSVPLQIGFAILSLALVSFMVLIVVAMAYVLMKMLGIPGWTALLGVIVLVFAYVLIGGANTSVYTNSVQALVMVAVALLLIGSGAALFSDGIGAFFGKLKAVDAHLVGLVNVKSPYFRNLFEVFVCNFLVGLAIVCQPHIMGKALSLKSNRDTNRYLATAILVGMVFMTVMLVGLFARVTLPPVARIDVVIPTYINTQFSPILGVIISIGVLCAGISTLEGLLLALSAILATDLFMPVMRMRRKDQDVRAQGMVALMLARGSLILLGGVCFVLGLHQMKNPTGGSVAIFAQYGIYCLFSASFAPMLFGMFLKRVVTSRVAILSAASAVVVYVGMSALKVTSMHNNPAVLSAFAIMTSLLVMVIGIAFNVFILRSARRRVEGWSKRGSAAV
jgi:SSS family solute:Na+ symporter/sodium/pantothenate symporter